MHFPNWIVEEVKKHKKDLKTNTSLDTQKDIKEYKLHTICDEALCPNKGECFKTGHATFLILGDICSRNCGFCAVKKGKLSPPDTSEPLRIANVVKKWELKYVVFTSPTRDDLPDGGAEQFARTIYEIKRLNPEVKVEPLTPDFKGNINSLKKVLDAKPDVFSHNIETVERLYSLARPQADYKRSLEILINSKKIAPDIPTKTAIMVGLGETKDEILKTIEDIYKTGCDILYIGQYISPGKDKIKTVKYYPPQDFIEFEKFAINLGFKAILSGPLVRSSYKAMEVYNKLNFNAKPNSIIR